MTRSLAIAASQITAICKGAAKAGFIAEVIINGVTVRLVPEQATPSQPSGEIDADSFSTLEEYLAWRDNAEKKSKQRPKGYL